VIVQQRFKLSGDQLTKLFFNIRKVYTSSSTLFNRFQDMKSTSAKLYKDHTGFTKDEFFFILNELKSLNNSPMRSKEQALTIYLTWLKTGISQESLASFFGIDSRRTMGHICSQVRESFIEDFVPKYLGCSSLTRDQWL